jgi:hypothetical protein
MERSYIKVFLWLTVVDLETLCILIVDQIYMLDFRRLKGISLLHMRMEPI